jgi:hypothetical protein
VSLKITLVDGNVFQANDALEPLDFENGIHQQEWIAMRKNFLDALVVENHFISSIFPPGCAFHFETGWDNRSAQNHSPRPFSGWISV